MRVSYVEIYMEKLTDLLVAEAPVATASTAGGTSNGGPRIRENEAGHTVLMGAETPLVASAQEVLQLLTVGTLARHTSATLMNEHSSRSHSIFTVMMEQRQRETVGGLEGVATTQTTTGPSVTSAMFHFCDLAGSERAKQTGNVGGRFKESVHINRWVDEPISLRRPSRTSPTTHAPYTTLPCPCSFIRCVQLYPRISGDRTALSHPPPGLATGVHTSSHPLGGHRLTRDAAACWRWATLSMR